MDLIDEILKIFYGSMYVQGQDGLEYRGKLEELFEKQDKIGGE